MWVQRKAQQLHSCYMQNVGWIYLREGEREKKIHRMSSGAALAYVQWALSRAEGFLFFIADGKPTPHITRCADCSNLDRRLHASSFSCSPLVSCLLQSFGGFYARLIAQFRSPLGPSKSHPYVVNVIITWVYISRLVSGTSANIFQENKQTSKKINKKYIDYRCFQPNLCNVFVDFCYVRPY